MKYLSALLILLLYAGIVRSQDSTAISPDNIINYNAEQNGSAFFSQHHVSPAMQFLYSNYVNFSSAFIGHAYLGVRQRNKIDLKEKYQWSTFKKAYTEPPVWDKDHWSYNYIIHPAMGSYSYLAVRNRGGKWWSAAFMSAFNSGIYEYVIASATQRPSINDLIITPVGGSIAGEMIYQICGYIRKDGHLSFAEKLIYTFADPFEVLRVGFNYERLLTKPNDSIFK